MTFLRYVEGIDYRLDDRGSFPGRCHDGAFFMRTGVFYPGVKLPVREADHSTASSAEVNMRGAIPPLPQYVLMSRCLIKPWIRFQVVVLNLSTAETSLLPSLKERL